LLITKYNKKEGDGSSMGWMEVVKSLPRWQLNDQKTRHWIWENDKEVLVGVCVSSVVDVVCVWCKKITLGVLWWKLTLQKLWMVVLMESVWIFFIFFGYARHNRGKWRATLMRRQGTQMLKKRNFSKTKYLVLDVLFCEWIFL
jgi:hypothetical protein